MSNCCVGGCGALRRQAGRRGSLERFQRHQARAATRSRGAQDRHPGYFSADQIKEGLNI